MKLFEYQAKEIFAAAGIPVPSSVLVEDTAGLDAALETAGLPCVLKAQVLTGGRGKAGLIRFAASREAAASALEALLKREGVPQVLVEQAVDIEKELYLSVSMEPVTGQALLMGCAEGGVEIEQLAAERPESILRQGVNLGDGLLPFQISDFVWRLGLRGDAFKQAGQVLRKLYEVFTRHDAELVEINPLFLTKDGGVVAGDGKLLIDDNSLFRQKANPIQRRQFASDAEYDAALEGIPYLTFGGDIGLMCAGAGLTNTVFDLIHYEGGSVSGYVEFGGPNYHKAEKAMKLCLSTRPKVILMVTFGTIARADVMAQGVADAIASLSPPCPIVTCLRGTGEEEARRILESIGLTCLSDTEEAVRAAIALSKGEGV
ncbi:MAG: ATP-grasp domain-containing protein [Candidatus Limiplasma sp.]|nr:ATP-grasp domain-containing protein [Candidatus Limiplasma sp.]